MNEPVPVPILEQGLVFKLAAYNRINHSDGDTHDQYQSDRSIFREKFMSEPDHKWGELGDKAKIVKRSVPDIIFFSPGEHRLRAGWRILAQLALLQVFLYFWIIPSTMDPAAFGDDQLLLALVEIGKAISITISVLVARKIIDQRSIPSLGLKLDRWTVVDFFCGVIISFVITGIGFLLLLLLELVEIRGFAWQTNTAQSIVSNLFGTFLIFALVGWSEEFMSRGYHLQNISEGSNIIWGMLISSLYFAYLHSNNPDITWLGLIFIFMGGMLFSYAYVTTKQLWLAIGLHAGWDFFVCVIFFGVPIGDLHIFRLIEVSTEYVSASAHVFFFYIEILMLACGGVLVRKFSEITRKRRNIPKLPVEMSVR